MVSISNNIMACILCFACSGCQKTDISRIYKETQASSLPDQTYISLFDEDLHEFIGVQEPAQQGADDAQEAEVNEVKIPEYKKDVS